MLLCSEKETFSYFSCLSNVWIEGALQRDIGLFRLTFVQVFQRDIRLLGLTCARVYRNTWVFYVIFRWLLWGENPVDFCEAVVLQGEKVSSGKTSFFNLVSFSSNLKCLVETEYHYNRTKSATNPKAPNFTWVLKMVMIAHFCLR